MKLRKNEDIRVLLKEKHLKQKDIAETLKMRPETLARYLSRDITPQFRHRIYGAILALTRATETN